MTKNPCAAKTFSVKDIQLKGSLRDSCLKNVAGSAKMSGAFRQELKGTSNLCVGIAGFGKWELEKEIFAENVFHLIMIQNYNAVKIVVGN